MAFFEKLKNKFFQKKSKRQHVNTFNTERVKRSAKNGHPISHQIAFLGNPNVGKSSLFTKLTGKHVHIGNWPGKTVEKMEGHFVLGGEYFSLVDLPGTYSLSARSEEEQVCCEFIVESEMDLLCVVADATRLERTLYVGLKALELTDNVAFIINMKDVAEKQGIVIDTEKIERQLGVPVIYVSATDPNDTIKLKKFLYDVLHTDKYKFHPAKILYSKPIESLIQSIESQIEDREVLSDYRSRWLAIMLLEGDENIFAQLEEEFDLSDIKSKLKKLEEEEDLVPAIDISKTRYSGIHRIVTSSTKGENIPSENLSDKVDKVVLHPFWGYPILILIFGSFFLITFILSEPIIIFIEDMTEQLGAFVERGLIIINSPPFLNDLLINGIIAGIGAVLQFLPIIIIFYALIAILEDSGYLARSAYLMDRIMHKFGLQGTSFMSYVMGFGCNVAGVMATRTVKNENEKSALILANSFIPCGATLGVVSIIASIFFKPIIAAAIMLLLYGFSISLAILSTYLFSLFYKKEEPMPLILEIPEYRKPNFNNIWQLTKERVGIFNKKAGVFIFSAIVIIWFLSNIPYGVPIERTIIGYVGVALAYITIPLFGFDMRMIITLVFGIFAKETIIASLSVLYGGPLKTSLVNMWNMPQIIAFLVFQLIYAPCIATISIIKAETGSWKKTLIAVIYPLFITSIITIIIYHLSRWLVGG